MREGDAKTGEGLSVKESEVDWKSVLFGRGEKDESLRMQSEERAANEWDNSEL